MVTSEMHLPIGISTCHFNKVISSLHLKWITELRALQHLIKGFKATLKYGTYVEMIQSWLNFSSMHSKDGGKNSPRDQRVLSY